MKIKGIAVVIAALTFSAMGSMAGDKAPRADSAKRSGKHSFTVRNTEKGTLTRLWVQVKGEWRDLDIGAGLAPGQTEKIEFDMERFGKKCEQTFNAAFLTGGVPSETQGFKFDVCSGREMTF